MKKYFNIIIFTFILVFFASPLNPFLNKVEAIVTNKLWTGNPGASLDSYTGYFNPDYWMLVSDNNGGAYAINNDDSVYVSYVDNSGSLEWEYELVAVAHDFHATTDTDGNLLITWSTHRDYGRIYAQKIDNSGTILWGTGGLRLTPAIESNQSQPSIVSDGEGGAVVAWSDSRLGSYSLWGQKISSGGVMQWSNLGIMLQNTNEVFNVASDDAGGIYVVWQNGAIMTVQRVSPVGTQLFGSGGVALGDGSVSQMDPLVVSDGENGIVVAWIESYTKVKMQRISADGTILWTQYGVTAANTVYSQWWDFSFGRYYYLQPLVKDSLGNYFVAWEDDQYGDWRNNVEVQKVNSSGVVQWSSNGVHVSPGYVGPDYGNYFPSLLPDNYGGVLVAYSLADGNSDDWTDAYLQNIDASGNLILGDYGLAVSVLNDGNESYSPRIVSGGVFRPIIGWYDYTNDMVLGQNMQILFQIDTTDPLMDTLSETVSIKSTSLNGVVGNYMIDVTIEGSPLAKANVQMVSDRDWSGVNGQIDLENGKSVVSGLASAPGIVGTHSLYIPKLVDQAGVHICPDAVIIDDVSLECSNGYELSSSDPRVSTVTVGENSYWLVSGLTGTGGLGYAIEPVVLTLTPDTDRVTETQEIIMSYTASNAFVTGDKVQLTWDEASLGSSLLNTCGTPTVDANGPAAGGDGSASIIGNNLYEYTFSTSTPASSFSFCVNVTATSTPGSYAVTLSDDNGNFSAALYYVGGNTINCGGVEYVLNGDNQSLICANIMPTLSFNIVDIDDTGDKNDCNFGSVTTQTLPPNYDSTIDNDRGECGYALAVGTNAVDGFSTYLISDGALRNSNASILDITTGSTFSTGTEAYGLVNVTVGNTGRSTTTGLYTEPFTRVSPFTEVSSGMRIPTSTSELYRFDDGVQYVQGTDSLDVTKVIHGIVIGAGTPAGMYQQILTYTVVPRF